MTKKIRILGIAPYKGLVTLMKQCALQYPEIELNAMAGNMEQGLAVARRYSEQYDIIVSRANTANMISQAVHIPVIDIGIGYYDVLRCIKMAQNTGTKFALLGFQSLTTIAKNLCDLLQIKLDIFSFSPESWKDSDRLLDNMKEQGYKTVICDMIPYDHAKLIGITPIILTSSAESVRLAIEGAIRTWHQNQKLLSSNAMLQTLIHSSSNRHLILDLNGNCLYSTLDAGKEDAFIDCLKKEISKSKNIPRRSFFITLENQLYSIRSSFSEEGAEPYLIFRVMPSKIPLSHSKYGITIMDKERAEKNFSESFYSNTELARGIIAATEKFAASDAPLMITGEIGTSKDRIAYIYYAKSHRCNNPLYVINCALLNDKTWNFLINHYNSPFTDNGNTIYISNLGVLSLQRQKHLLSIILDTNLHVRNRLIFSCTQAKDGHLPHAALEYSNMLGCIPLPTKPMREQKNDLVASASLYIDTLNQDLGRQVVGLSDEAARRLLDYDYPCNRTQFKRILKKAVLGTSTAYISGETIETILKEESVLFPAEHPAHATSHEISHEMSHGQPAAEEKPAFSLNLEQSLDQISRDIVLHVLALCDGNQTAAAQRIGISRTTLWRYVNR